MELIVNSRILEKRVVAEKTTEVSFERPSSFIFEAGQYLQLIVPELLYEDARSNSRVFSIASSPKENSLTIAFRDTGSGYKRTLTDPGFSGEVIVRGPFGRDFALPKSRARRAVFVAGGIGITPFLSMIRFATKEGFSLPITLLYANKSKEAAAYLGELERIAENNPNFVLKSKFGQVNKEFLLQAGELGSAEWYVAGPALMVEKARNLLTELGVTTEKIHLEKFTGY